ncbi:glucose-6-phosphate dehydrogenase [Candidatus Daviesbacteria bacterium]|nr:glucose-6-phosphate dehydrogenase [Candidatus Daviesbacteria bacterium]
MNSDLRDSFALIIFGITSNLAQIKLIPALYDMATQDLLPEKMVIIGNARRQLTKKDFEVYIFETLSKPLRHHAHPIDQTVVKKLVEKMRYIQGNLDDSGFYDRLNDELKRLSRKGIHCENRIFYLATYPDLYSSVFENLKKIGLNKQDSGFVRLMIEKPIGNDLSSARTLNQLLHKYFSEDQIYRLDHYLGKETLQNILAFRFGNGVFEPLINSDFIDHIQITGAENFGIGKRGGYYDKVGALKDVGQNHHLQMLAFVTMDAPSEFSNEAVTKERIKILKNLVPLKDKVVFGQYEGYRNEENVAKGSTTDTFYAFKTFINNQRFKNTPIYIRAGKNLAQDVTEIVFVFKTPVNRLFKYLEIGDEPNILIYRIQPNEGIVLGILTKKPGHKLELENSYMQFCYRLDRHGHYLPDPYERLIADAIRGDQTFFNDAAEIEAQWAFTDPLSKTRKKPIIYKVGTWGPKEADELIKADDRSWITPSMDFCVIN